MMNPLHPMTDMPTIQSRDNAVIQDERLFQDKVTVVHSVNANAVVFNFRAKQGRSPHSGIVYRTIQSKGPVYGARIISKSASSMLIETVYADLDDARNAIAKGVTYLGDVVCATPSFPPEAEIVQVDFTSLPFLPRDKLYQDIKDTMKAYGRVCQISLYVEPETRVFMGDATVILDTTPLTANDETSEPYQRMLGVSILFDAWDQHVKFSDKTLFPYCRYCFDKFYHTAKCAKCRPLCNTAV